MKRYLRLYTAVILVSFLGIVTYLSPILLIQTPNKVSAESVSPMENSYSEIMTELPDTNVIVRSCTGNWVYFDSVGKKVDLGYESLNTWNIKSNASILVETQNNENTVLLGHNYCEGGNCFKPTTDFGLMINVKQGEFVSACINGNLFEGEVLVSQAMADTSTHILDNWLDKPTVTLFTCYGNCRDAECNNVESRWVVAFEKY